MATSDAERFDDLDAWLSDIVAGDHAAFAAWLAGAERRLRASLRPYAIQLDTEAIMQETLLRVWIAAPRFVPDDQPNALLRFALRIARNLAVSELRRNRAEPRDIEEIERAAEALALNVSPASADDLALRAVIVHCWEGLPAAPASAMGARLRSGGADPDDVLAARLGMKKNTFLQNITRARKFLADCLKRNGVNLAEELP